MVIVAQDTKKKFHISERVGLLVTSLRKHFKRKRDLKQVRGPK